MQCCVRVEVRPRPRAVDDCKAILSVPAQTSRGRTTNATLFDLVVRHWSDLPALGVRWDYCYQNRRCGVYRASGASLLLAGMLPDVEKGGVVP